MNLSVNKGSDMNNSKFELYKEYFIEKERELLSFQDITVIAFRYASGIEAIRLENNRGHIVILPFYGQMIWEAVFDGVDLTMENMFSEPKYANNIAGTYGCFAFHSGILNNGCPSPKDTHELHGEMPCAKMDRAYIEFNTENDGKAWLKLISEYEYVMGFGSHYLATPSVTITQNSGLVDIAMQVKNLSTQPMNLMYMCHVNFAFCENATIIQPIPFTPENTVVRTQVPGHVNATKEYLDFIEQLRIDPSVHEKLDQPQKYNPEQVFYLKGLIGEVSHLLKRREEDSFCISYSTQKFDHTARWILYNSDQKVAAFALPSTCDPEGFLTEKEKGNVKILKGGEITDFVVRLGYLNKSETETCLKDLGRK